MGHIIDGDTVDVIVDGAAFRVRLLGLDSPECEKDTKPVDGIPRFRCVPHADNDHWGWEAYCAMVEIASAQPVTVECEPAAVDAPCSLDPFDRTLAYLRLDDGRDAGEALIRAGGAWSFTRYASDRRAAYCDAEDQAIEDGAGMWAIGRDAVLAAMDGGTRGWYRDRDGRCDAARAERD